MFHFTIVIQYLKAPLGLFVSLCVACELIPFSKWFPFAIDPHIVIINVTCAFLFCLSFNAFNWFDFNCLFVSFESFVFGWDLDWCVCMYVCELDRDVSCFRFIHVAVEHISAALVLVKSSSLLFVMYLLLQRCIYPEFQWHRAWKASG